MKLKKKRIVLDIIVLSFIVLFFCFFIGMMNHPEETSQFFGFRYYVVLTDSMESKIPTYSLVFTKTLDETSFIEPNSIVTFKANRMGEDVLITHYFRETQEANGKTFYRTQGVEAPEYDNYETTRSDIVGEYMFHIPYIGKLILFLQSQFSWILYAELAVIWLVNKTIQAHWDEKDNGKLEPNLNQ